MPKFSWEGSMSVLNRSLHVHGRRNALRTGSVAATAAGLVLGMAQMASAGSPPKPPPPPPPPAAKPLNNQFFDWQINTTPGFIQSPFLTNSNASAVNAFLEKLPANAIRAVKVEVPLNTATTNLIFNNPKYTVSYVLGDIETDTEKNTQDLVRRVRFVNGQNNGTKTRSYNAFVGTYGIQKYSKDITWPSNYQGKKDEHSFSGFGMGAYNSTKVNMSMPEMYPGSGSMRNPAAGNSDAPNIRSALFTMPILRLSQVAVNVDDNERIIPWIARFNNSGNLALDTDRNPANGYRFVPGQPIPARFGLPALSASQTANQMLSRRDFAAQVAHYRLRGADSFVLFEPGVVGYLSEQKRTDAKQGWTQSNIDSIFKASDATLLLGKDTDYKKGNNKNDYNGNIIIDGKDQLVEEAGALFSGVYSLTLKRMDVLLSNMDDEEHDLTLPSKIGGFTLKTRTFEVDAGTHLLVEYKLTTTGVNKGWSVSSSQIPFLNLPNNRTEIGIPEPGTITLAAVAGFFAISRRRRAGKAEAAERASGSSPLVAGGRRPAGLIGGNMAAESYV